MLELGHRNLSRALYNGFNHDLRVETGVLIYGLFDEEARYEQVPTKGFPVRIEGASEKNFKWAPHITFISRSEDGGTLKGVPHYIPKGDRFKLKRRSHVFPRGADTNLRLGETIFLTNPQGRMNTDGSPTYEEIQASSKTRIYPVFMVTGEQPKSQSLVKKMISTVFRRT